LLAVNGLYVHDHGFAPSSALDGLRRAATGVMVRFADQPPGTRDLTFTRLNECIRLLIRHSKYERPKPRPHADPQILICRVECEANHYNAMRYLFSAIVISAALAVPPAPAQAVSAMAARIDRAASFYQNRDGFMGMVAVARDHQIIFQRGYGYANLESQISFTPDTRFRIGSLTKQFTAAAILLLQQDGKLKTRDLISRFYPSAPAAWSKISLRNLLTHTSGIPDIDFGLVAKNSLKTPEGLMKGIPEKALEFQPGTRAEYANINFMLLGRVIEQVSGEPYCRFLQERIFSPLQLTETGCDTDANPAPQRAVGYRPSAHGPVVVEDYALSTLTGAGNLDSSAGDLIRWTEALHGGKVLSSASLTEMTTPFLDYYGYGLQIDTEDGALDISHNGTVDGFFSFLDYIPKTKTTVVILSNLVGEGNHTTPGTLALDTELVHLAINDDAILPSEGKEANVPEKTLRAYSGRYRSTDAEHLVFVVVTYVDGHLYVKNEGAKGAPPRMFAETSSKFYLTNQEVELTFDPRVPGSLQFVDFSGIGGALFMRVPESGTQAPDHGPSKGAARARSPQ
jgi:CubicO group peptidase (beta-lactamase class C family)